MPISPPWSKLFVRERAKRRSDSSYASAGPQQMQLAQKRLFAVWNPDIFDLSGMLEEPAPFRQCRVEPIDDAPLVCPNLLQVAGGHGPPPGDCFFDSLTPNPINVVVFRQSLQ